MLLKYRMNSKMYHDMKSYYSKVYKLNIAQVEYDYKLHSTEECNKLTNDENQQKINNEYLNKYKSDLIIAQLEVEQFKQYTKDFMAVHPTIKYPINIE